MYIQGFPEFSVEDLERRSRSDFPQPQPAQEAAQPQPEPQPLAQPRLG